MEKAMFNTRFLCTETSHSAQKTSILEAQTETVHKYLKGANVIGEKAVDVLSGGLVVAAERSKPIVHCWSVNSETPIFKSTVPGIVSRLIVSTKSNYIIMAIGNNVYIWLANNGQFLTTIDDNATKITTLAITKDDNYIITGAQDGTIMVFVLTYCIAQRSTLSRKTEEALKSLKVKYKLSEHTSAINDLFISGINLECPHEAPLYSISADKTFKTTSLKNGQVEFSIIFNDEPKVLFVKNTEDQAFCGLENGDINIVNLFEPPRFQDSYVGMNTRSSQRLVLKGHAGAILCLNMLRDYQTLVSSAKDKRIILWDVISGRRLKTIERSSPITNIVHDQFQNFNIPEEKSKRCVHSLMKTGVASKKIVITIYPNENNLQRLNQRLLNKNGFSKDYSKRPLDSEAVLTENKKLKSINKKLYLSLTQKFLEQI